MRKRAVDQFTKEGVYVRSWLSVSEAERVLGVSGAHIRRALDFENRTEGGFKWKTCLSDHGYRNSYEMKVEYTDQQRQEFNNRIVKFLPVLYNLIRKYDFINSFNKDDYKQEALLYAWRQYYCFEGRRGDDNEFGAWLKITFTWGIFGYYHQYAKWRTKEFDDELHDKEEEDYSTARVLALYKAIDSLNEKQRTMVEMWMDGKKPFEIAEAVDVKVKRYFREFEEVKAVVADKFRYHFYGIQESRRSIRRGGGRCLPIEQYDLQGRFVARFSSLKATKEQGFNTACISDVLNRRRREYAGFMWKEASAKQTEAA